MFASVSFSYRDGTHLEWSRPPAIGQLVSESAQGVQVLHLYSVDWLANAPRGRPIASLWRPEFCGVSVSNVVLRGLEQAPGKPRRWLAQKWLCEVITATSARERLKPETWRHSLIKSSVPPPPGGYGPAHS